MACEVCGRLGAHVERYAKELAAASVREAQLELEVAWLRQRLTGEGEGPILPESGVEGIVLPPSGVDLARLLAEIDESLVAQALERTGGNITHAAGLLGMNRSTLAERLRKRRAA